MKEKIFHRTTGILFLIVGALHLIRAVITLPVTFGNFMMPVWFSYFAAAFIFWLSYESFKLSKKR